MMLSPAWGKLGASHGDLNVQPSRRRLSSHGTQVPASHPQEMFDRICPPWSLHLGGFRYLGPGGTESDHTIQTGVISGSKALSTSCVCLPNLLSVLLLLPCCFFLEPTTFTSKTHSLTCYPPFVIKVQAGYDLSESQNIPASEGGGGARPLFPKASQQGCSSEKVLSDPAAETEA